ncbi:VOC family protein [Saccharopolyspora sp. TS4A08]|uniref:VOC family protein n=1 Tax=Saccharopolyspora ipomoeae TaxID=3042027 RepID=A0ABT6PQ88_9PSEU|nr:VOC family protein [Saccharopolyspora sp. TS4A08]MDI2029606.1 VOC family protein [Saccharopolyspora sp. TS4A08]
MTANHSADPSAATAAIRHVEIGCRNLARSREFYSELLGFPEVAAESGISWLDAGPARIKLVEVGEGDLGGWEPDDLQCGMRHVGMKVGDVDAQAARLREAGVEFTAHPKDAHGGVRITFFTDPDGTLLEFVEGAVQHDEIASHELAAEDLAAHQNRPRAAGPVFDHVAVTAPDLQEALDFYVRTLGARVIGKLVRGDDPRGFVITNVRVGDVVLELFTFRSETRPSTWSAGQSRHGLRSLGLGVAEARGAVGAMTAAGAGAVLRPGTEPLLIDPHGVPLTITTRAVGG